MQGGMKLTFLGAAGTVTGSKYLLAVGRRRILIDCGLFQGVKNLRTRNWAPPLFDPAALDAVVLTHAHLDHTGYLPVLVKQGYRGPVYCTTATLELCRILLPDSGFLQEEEARFLNKKQLTSHAPALPLYTQAEAEATLARFEPVPFATDLPLARDVRVRMTRAGHILGSACLQVEARGRTIVFSGDVGRLDDPVMRPPLPVGRADYLVVESTYGNRRHPPVDPAETLREVIERTTARRGTVVIPAFAVGRTQSVLYLIAQLRKAGRLPEVPVYLNSPMAIDATGVYCAHAGEHKLSERQCRETFAVAEFVRTKEASQALNTNDGPAVIISASGMATGGRVVHHLKTLLPDPRNTVLFTGFQAPGTRGEALVSGADEVKIHGEYVPVRADIVELPNLSAHGDYLELLDWLGHFERAPQRTFITHGEPVAADAFRHHVMSNLGWSCRIPEHEETVALA
jgi:metallo-beta-lactamase family protein